MALVRPSSHVARQRIMALAVLLGSLLVYLANGRSIPSQDTIPARLLPISLWREANFNLDEFSFPYERGKPYYLQFVRGHYVSTYPVGAPILALPFYLPVVLAQADPHGPAIVATEKIAAAALVALSAAMLFLTMGRIVSPGTAMAFAVVYALGTSSLSQSSQALWQHGAAQLALSTGLYCIVRARAASGWVALAGLPLAFAVVCRPADALIAAPIAACALVAYPGRATGLLGGAALPVGFQLWYNARYLGTPFWLYLTPTVPESWGTFFAGLDGILLSPARGLLIYSPVFILSIAGGIRVWRRGGDPLLRALCFSVVAYLLLTASMPMWWGGYCYGPRLLADVTPALILLLTPLAPLLERRRVLAGLFLVLAAWSVALHGIGALSANMGWNVRRDIDRHPERLWAWTDNQPVECVRALLGAADHP